MSIYVIGDLHLSLTKDKPMSIFGEIWKEHEKKIKRNWLEKVKENDYIILPGDFSWATYLEEAHDDFKYLNELPGRKILLKGNHDYWWTTITNMKKYLEKNEFNTIDFLHNNSYFIEDKIIVGTRGWNLLETENSEKMINRENNRLKLSIEDGIQKYGKEKEIVVFMHYPPITINNANSEFVTTMKQYKVKRCYYAHLHGNSHKDAIEGLENGINFKLISADYLKFDLFEI